MSKTKINLSLDQLKKIAIAHKKKYGCKNSLILRTNQG